MISYEVTARLDKRIAEEYERYLREEHIPDLMATGCFLEATFARQEEVKVANDDPWIRFRSSYLAPDRAALERYFREHAERLRGDALARFPAGLEPTREEWALVERWKGDEPADGGDDDGAA